MKRVRNLLAVTILAGSIVISGNYASAATFKDVKKDFWADDEIHYVVDQKLMKGYSNGLFQPNKTITKAQSAAIIAKALNLKTNKKSSVTFSDVPKLHSAYKEISAVVEAGIFPKEKKFKPDEPMTRELTAQVLVNAFKLEGSGSVQFKDVSKKSKSYGAISALTENDIALISQDGKFKPTKKVTRAEFSVFMARALNKDFLPTQYNIPQNVNPVVRLFDYALKNPKGMKTLFATKDDFGFINASKDIEQLELIELQEIARLNGTVELSAKLNVQLKGNKKGLLSNGENTLYFLITREDYMEFKIVSVSQKPQLQGDDSILFTKDKALSLIRDAKQSYWYIVSGGEGKRDETLFMYNGNEYRYMGESLNTMEKLKSYLGKYYTPEEVEAFVKKLGYIEKDGKLAQPNADGGSILNWEKATIKQTANSIKTKKYELQVPVGDFYEFETMHAELHFVEGIGWRIKSIK